MFDIHTFMIVKHYFIPGVVLPEIDLLTFFNLIHQCVLTPYPKAYHNKLVADRPNFKNIIPKQCIQH